MSRKIKHREVSQRKIQIKPIELPKEPVDIVSAEDELSMILDKLEKAKQELIKTESEEKNLLEEVRATIAQEKEQWQEEKLKWVEEAKAEGYQAGFKQGEVAGKKSYEESIEIANHIVDLVKVDYQKTLEKTEDVIIQLGMHTAEKIIETRLEEDPDLFLNIVRSALKEIKDQSIISIYLHPTNYETVLTQKDELKRILETDTKLSLYIKEDLEKNSCIIEHPFGQIDATVDTQLGQIRSALSELVMESKQ
ncbi:flagellar assembly protein FliH [Oceanobacillus sp. CAU 1775]